MSDESGKGGLPEAALRLAARAAGRVLADPRGQEAVARAVGLAQRSLERVEQVQASLMKAAGIPGRQDYEELARSLARVKRKARALARRLEESGAPGAAPVEDPLAEEEAGDGPAETRGDEGAPPA